MNSKDLTRLESEIAEDENLANFSGGEPEWVLAEQASCECCANVRSSNGSLVCTPDDRDAPHIARHDPARILRETDGRRLLLQLHGRTHSCPTRAGESRLHPPYGCPTVDLLLLGYGHQG